MVRAEVVVMRLIQNWIILGDVLRLLAHHVGPVAADGGQDVLGDPALELFGLGHARAHDEGVQPRLVDHGHVRVAANRLPIRESIHVEGAPVFIFDVLREGRGDCSGIAERLADVGRDEPGLAVDLDGAEVEGGGEGSDHLAIASDA
jgi:hypothetical protein